MIYRERETERKPEIQLQAAYSHEMPDLRFICNEYFIYGAFLCKADDWEQ